jgi:hypothetical protein
MTDKLIRLAVGVPAFGMQIDVGHGNMWLMLGHALCANEEVFSLVSFRTVSMNPVADARNDLVNAALEKEADWLLMVDADTYYEGEDAVPILQMIRDAWRAGAAAVAAPVRARGWKEHQRTVWMLDETPKILAPGVQRPGEATMSVADEERYRGKLVPCLRIGAAFMAVNLHWIRGNLPDPPWFTHEPAMVGPRQGRLRSHGEDVVFCDMIRIRDGLLLVDGRIYPKHVMDGERL